MASLPRPASWHLATGEGGHVVFAPPLQDGHIAKVVRLSTDQ